MRAHKQNQSLDCLYGLFSDFGKFLKPFQISTPSKPLIHSLNKLNEFAEQKKKTFDLIVVDI